MLARGIAPISALAVALLNAGLSVDAAAAWPSFRGDRLLTGVATTVLGDSLRLHWTFAAEDGIESTVAVGDSLVYVGTMGGHLHALELESGTPRWTYNAEAEIKSSPLLLDQRVYFGDEAGAFHSIDAKTGMANWVTRTGANIISSANALGGRLYFGSYDNHLYCVAKSDGAIAWKYPTEGYIHGTPVIFGNAVAVAGCDGYLQVLDAVDGSVMARIGLGSYVGASVAVGAGNRAFVGTFDNQVLGLDLLQNRVLWRFKDQKRAFPFIASAAVLDSLVVVGGRDQTVRGLHARTGQLLWTFAAGAKVDSSPVISGDRVYLGTYGGQLFGLNLYRGTEEWQFAAGGAILASPAVADGKMVIGSTNGTLYCFGDAAIIPPSAEEYE